MKIKVPKCRNGSLLDSFAALRAAGLDPADILRRNDAYPALERIGGLIHTGPTGTNVNDLAMLLLPRRE